MQNTGNATAANVDVTDDISSLLAHGSFGSASNGGSFGGSTVHWDNVTVAPNATQSFTFSVKLDLGGWATGTTTLANTVVVAGSDCASGASNAACRVSTTISPRFSLSLTKGAAGGSSGPWVANYSATAGDTVWYQVRVTNTGNAAVTGVQVSDSLGFPAGQCATPPSSLTPGAGWTCVYFRTVTEGTITNTATADSAQTSSVTDTATVVAGPAPAPDIAISKTASPTQLPVGGGNVTYTIMVTNPGNVALSNVTVSDDHCVPLTLQGGDANDNSRLDPNESWRYTCGATLTTSTTNTATAAGTYGSTRVSATAKATVTVLLAAPGLHLEKSASPESLPVGGGTATYTYVVTNIGNAALSNVGVTDDKCSPVTYVSGDENSNNRLDLTETWRFTCSATLTVTTTNHARATGSTGDVVASDTDQATVTVAESQPAIRVVAAANPTSLPPGGGQVTWTYVVTNPGNSALTGVTLSDQACTSIALLGGDTNGNNRLDLGETWQFRCSANITATTTSTVTATGHAGTATVADTDSTTVAVTASSTGINVVKTANPTTLPAAGGSVTYTYVVTNKGNVALSGVSVVDDKCTTVSARGGDANGNSRLDPGETWTYTCVATITQTTTNTALATGFYETLPVTDTDTALVTVGTPAQHTPRIGLTLSASPVVLPDGGGEVTYTYAVANKGDVPLANVTVKDDTCAPLGTPTGDTDGNGVLDLTEVWTYTCTMLVTANTSTTATASGQADGQTVEAMDIATVTLTPPAPTATPSESPTPTGAAPTGSGGSSPGTSPTGGTAGSTGTGTSSSTPGGAVAGATSPAKSSAAPTNTGLQINTGTTPSGLVMILVLMLGIAAAVLIMTLSKRTSNL